MMIKDSMVLIHLAKTSLLSTSCDYFGNILIPNQVKEEVMKGQDDTIIIQDMINKGKITVKSIKNKKFIEKAYEFNIQKAEAEAVALYWETDANLLATDDYNVRKKREILNLNIIGTPAIILKLFEQKRINRIKFEESIKKMKSIGWFSNTVWDKIQMEANKNE